MAVTAHRAVLWRFLVRSCAEAELTACRASRTSRTTGHVDSAHDEWLAPVTEGRDYKVIIIGFGFAGLCLGMQLRRAGIDSFLILEKTSDIGGTWRDNAYPGAACDVPSFLYCFSFEMKTDWSRKWAPQPEILDYIRHCAKKYDLLSHVRSSTEVESASYDEAASRWSIRTRDGREFRTQFLVSAVGQLNRPHVPDLEGLGGFQGSWFHSARWRRDVELTGKSMAVIGNAASAVQLIPEVAPRVARLNVFQRSANWILPKNDLAYSERQKARFSRLPALARAYRWLLWFVLEISFPVLRLNPFLQWLVRLRAHRHLETQVADARLRKALVPDYPVGAKRILITDDYYPALQRSNVSLVTDPISRILPRGIETADGKEYPADILVLATGFETTSFLAPMELFGRDGRRLNDAWRDGAEAYLGITVTGFPNFFMMYGPNTNLGHNSILFMLECQSRYIIRCLQEVDRRGAHSLEVLPEAFASYNQRIQVELQKTVWARIGASWYKLESGRITNNWYGPVWKYWLATRRPDFSAYRIKAD